MSGLTLSEIRAALGNQIRTNIDREINVYDVPHGDYSYPAITIGHAPDYLDYWLTMGSAGHSAVRFILRVETGGTTSESATIALDDYLSAGTGNGSSIIDALMADQTLGLAGCTSHIRGVTVDPLSITAELLVEVTIKKVGANA